MKQIWFKRTWWLYLPGTCPGNHYYTCRDCLYGAGLYGRRQKRSLSQ